MTFHLSLTETDIKRIICVHIEHNYGVPAEPGDLKESTDGRTLDFYYNSKTGGRKPEQA